MKSDYRRILEEEKQVREKDFDLAGFLNVLEPYYRGGEYDFLLNSDKQLDLLTKRFHRLRNRPDKGPSHPVPRHDHHHHGTVHRTRMRRLKGIRKMVVIEEAWKAIASANMADYIRYLYKTVRKFYGGGGGGHAGGGGHHFLADSEREHHQQLGLQDSP